MCDSSYEWKVGDRVVLMNDEPAKNPDLSIGDEGTICAIVDREIGVRWDHKVQYGHDCSYGDGEKCEIGYGWWVFDSQIEPGESDDLAFEIDEDRFISLISEIK